MTRGFVFFLIVALVAGVALWGYIGKDGQDEVLRFLKVKADVEVEAVRLVEVSLGGAVVRAELAETPADREQGLAGRIGLADLSGMLFLFDEPGQHGFWMKGMTFPIDIIWINDSRVVDVASDVQPSTEAFPPLLTPRAPANRVLEVKAGFARKYGIVVGTPVSIRFDVSR